MAKKTKAAKAAAAGAAAKGAKNVKNVRTMAQDVDQEELRDNVRAAFEAARDAYERINGKGAAALFEDARLHEDVRQAAGALRSAGGVLAKPTKKKRKGGFGRLLVLGAVGAVAAVALSEGLRNKVLDALFGAEEEFDYTSTTTPNGASSGTAAGAPAGAAS